MAVTITPVNVGSVADDGTGDTARDAFVKVNANEANIKADLDTALQPVMTTKGDLEGFSTVRARLPVGTDTHVLTADSAEALGVKWAAPSAAAVEGTAVLSTGEGGGSKFLREDGDGTSSWQAIPGGGDALTSSPLSQFAATTSLQLAGVMSDETGTGALVFANSPTLVTPALGTPASGVATNLTGTATGLTAGGVISGSVDVADLANGIDGELITWDAAGAPATVAVGTATHVLTSNGTGAAPTFQATGDALTTNPLSQFAATTSAQLAGVLSDETGSGAAVFATSPTLVTPALGTPASGNLSNCNGYTQILAIACSDETTALTTGTGKAEFQIVDGAFTLTAIYATVTTAPTGSTIIVDVNLNGTTLMATNKISIDASEKTSDTAATAPTLTTTALTENGVITIDIDQIGSSTAGAGLKVYLVGYWT